ncbi:RNase adapter RapZ [Sphingomonas montanisoli]|uniref:RNase adapter RapZ n=1 Tax=Sphingomonas montanisoli TaxID=2606412 RepID=A0A5D9CCL5_9SPHN|nr:RNase adapter RapZ [Sphingomonas montanisoli]TZG29003.1 RNase adapter RapZ [Sphingomonas montanisoli]
MTAPRPDRILFVTGMSGSGKKTALKTFEDMGWETVDNLPLSLVDSLLGAAPAEGAQGLSRPVAIGIDSRTREFDVARIVRGVRQLRDDQGRDASILFLDASGAEIARRYSETRSRHPLALDRPIEDGITYERELMAPLREAADHLIETTGRTTNDLQALLRQLFGATGQPSQLTVMSFAFSRGVPRDADLVFDMRFLRNPHWDSDLRPMTGLDAAVGEYISADPIWPESLRRIEELLLLLLPRYEAEGKSYVTIAIGCTGGKHRSVHMAETIAARLRDAGFSPTLRHRDLVLKKPDVQGDGRAGVMLKRSDG